MNRDDIIRMAREARWIGNVEGWTFNGYEELERFAALVAAAERDANLQQIEIIVEAAVAAEREACLSILRDMEGKKWHTVIHGGEMKGVSLHDAYMAIRARGQG